MTPGKSGDRDRHKERIQSIALGRSLHPYGEADRGGQGTPPCQNTLLCRGTGWGMSSGDSGTIRHSVAERGQH